MDDAFGFKNDSHILKPGVKDRIRKIVKIYSEELFRDNQIRAIIDNVFIVGHASPRFQGKYISPNSNNHLAYTHNLDLSSQRANQIVKFIFSKQMGTFQYKNFFKQKIFSSGRGFSAPVPRPLAKIRMDAALLIVPNREGWKSSSLLKTVTGKWPALLTKKLG
ncbi:MAG: hypothetical protein HN509_08285 [Halobacteriovoraceae bacterium]|jgi:outer membrane protein OmpA-like peptidoglycan-associated protein|nr:hypothetical protein [Halobacteriovoraceae bacterium]MBT5094257.1 hypothetical protein [Halobacteriovoraceae bacterium]